jgi:hypothetical protein
MTVTPLESGADAVARRMRALREYGRLGSAAWLLGLGSWALYVLQSLSASALTANAVVIVMLSFSLVSVFVAVVVGIVSLFRS